MISTEVQSAMQALHSTVFGTGESYRLDLTDRALDELVRKPGCRRPGAFQVRSARANAVKVIRSRRAIVDAQLLRNRVERPGVRRPERLAATSNEGETEILDWLATTPSLTPEQRGLLLDLANGEDAQTIAARECLPLNRIQERVSRARSAGWAAYQSEMVSP